MAAAKQHIESTNSEIAAQKEDLLDARIGIEYLMNKADNDKKKQELLESKIEELQKEAKKRRITVKKLKKRINYLEEKRNDDHKNA